MNLPANRQQTIRGLSPGTRLGRYTVVRRVGSGGMAELYLARLDGPEGFVKPVALKLMHPHLSDDAHFAQMFLKEARIAATLEHEAIVQVLDVGEFGGEYFMALEFVHGKDLRRLLADLKAPMAIGAALRVVLEVGRALHYAHRLRDPGGRALGIVHRDVSPSNVLLSFRGGVKLADFGVAKMAERTNATASGSLKGKLGYMSPEQCLQEHVDARSDVFSLGVVLYETTTGRRAFRADQPVTVMNRVIDGDWAPPEKFVPGYPRKLHEILAKALEPDADQRYRSTEALCMDLEDFAKAAGLEVGAAALSDLLEDCYGQPALPDLEVPTVQTPRLRTVPLDENKTIPIEVLAPPVAAGTRRLATGIALVAVLGTGGVLGWKAARSTAVDETDATEVPTAVPIREAVVTSPAPVQPAVEAAKPDVVPTEAVAPAEAEAEVEEALAEAEEPKPSSSRRNKRKRRRKPDSHKGDDALNALLPPSAR